MTSGNIQRVQRIVPTSSALFPPWECLNCGECCKEASISKIEHKLILKKIGSRLGERFKEETKPHSDNPDYMALKGKCMFFHKEKRKCLIYTIRPFACRLFMCGRQDHSEPLMYTKDRCINNIMRRKRDPYFRDLVMKNREESFKWGFRYGWKKGDFL